MINRCICLSHGRIYLYRAKITLTRGHSPDENIYYGKWLAAIAMHGFGYDEPNMSVDSTTCIHSKCLLPLFTLLHHCQGRHISLPKTCNLSYLCMSVYLISTSSRRFEPYLYMHGYKHFVGETLKSSMPWLLSTSPINFEAYN